MQSDDLYLYNSSCSNAFSGIPDSTKEQPYGFRGHDTI